ncbi:MAG: HD domain-containing protein [Planctomycetota bacterium]
MTGVPDWVRSGGIVRLPAGQDVPFPPRVRALTDTPAFQRLRSISQLGVVSRVYPGATHSRFEHAIGVFGQATGYLESLGRSRAGAGLLDAGEADVILAAALLHDLGHWPFCHPVEDMKLPDLPDHEAAAAKFLGPGSELTAVLRDEWGVDAADVLDVLDGDGGGPLRKLSRSLLSGPIDVDKVDYLDRDSLHCGVPYGRNFDRSRLIASLTTNEAGDRLAITEKGRTAAELMVFARYVMFSEVYWHHAVRSATAMFARTFHAHYRDLAPETWMVMAEPLLIEELGKRAAGGPTVDLFEGVFGRGRKLFKRVAEFSLFQRPEIYRRVARRPYGDLLRLSDALADELRASGATDVAATDLLFDAPPPGREVEFDVEIVFRKEGRLRSLAEVSPVTETLARKQFDDYVKRVRLFVHPDRVAAVRSAGDPAELIKRVLDRLEFT